MSNGVDGERGSVEIFALGVNSFGQLGIGDRIRKERYIPTKFGVVDGTNGDEATPYDGNEVVDVQCGGHFTCVLKRDGDVELSGCITGEIFPRLTRVHVPFPPKAVQVACGIKHCLLLFDSSCVLSWGTGYFGQLGHGDDNTLEEPMLIKALTPQALGYCRVTSIAAGGNHSGAVTNDGPAFMWGLNRSGQCGVALKADSILSPKPIATKKIGGSLDIKKLVCGRNHSGLLTNDGKVYTWGATSFGRTGQNVSTSTKIISSPAEIPLFSSQPARDLVSGDFHMLALAAGGNGVYSWGYGCDGQCGQSSLLHLRTPRLIEHFNELNVEIDTIECGSTWSMAKDADGYLYAWGYGDGGWMGLKPPPSETMPVLESDNAADYPIIHEHEQIQSFDCEYCAIVPQRVTLLKNKVVHSVRCGGGHTILITSPRASRPAHVLEGISDEKESNFMLASSDEEPPNEDATLSSGAERK